MKNNKKLKITLIIMLMITFTILNTVVSKATDGVDLMESIVNSNGSSGSKSESSGSTKTTSSSSDSDDDDDDDGFISAEIEGVKEIKLSSDTLTLEEGKTGKISYTITPDTAKDDKVTFESSDKNVATVKDGTVTAVKAGTCTITVKSSDGKKSAECKVTVTAKEVSTYSNNVTETSKLPQSGIEDWNFGFVLIGACIISALYAIKKIRDYQNL